MKLLKKLSKKATAFALAMALLFGMNTMSAFAATPDPGISPQTVITPWNGPISVAGAGHMTSGIGVRAGETIRVDLTILGVTYDRYNSPLQVALHKRDGTFVEMVTYSAIGSYSHTFTAVDGGAYYISFGTRGSSYRINYSVTF